MKKAKKTGQRNKYLEVDTGKTITVDFVEYVEYQKDNNFHKLFLKNFTESLYGIFNKKTALCFWILSNITRDNKLLYTYRQISQKTGYSYKTVADTMQTLLEQDFLCQLGHGHYMVNPNLIFWGSYQRRCIAIREYNQIKSDNLKNSDKLRLFALNKNIRQLEKQKEKLELNLAAKKSKKEIKAEEKKEV